MDGTATDAGAGAGRAGEGTIAVRPAAAVVLVVGAGVLVGGGEEGGAEDAAAGGAVVVGADDGAWVPQPARTRLPNSRRAAALRRRWNEEFMTQWCSFQQAKMVVATW